MGSPEAFWKILTNSEASTCCIGYEGVCHRWLRAQQQYWCSSIKSSHHLLLQASWAPFAGGSFNCFIIAFEVSTSTSTASAFALRALRVMPTQRRNSLDRLIGVVGRRPNKCSQYLLSRRGWSSHQRPQGWQFLFFYLFLFHGFLPLHLVLDEFVLVFAAFAPVAFTISTKPSLRLIPSHVQHLQFPTLTSIPSSRWTSPRSLPLRGPMDMCDDVR